jgi:hypothetical protein
MIDLLFNCEPFLFSPGLFTWCPSRPWGASEVFVPPLVSQLLTAPSAILCLQWEADRRESIQSELLAKRNVSISSGKAGTRL